MFKQRNMVRRLMVLPEVFGCDVVLMKVSIGKKGVVVACYEELG